MDNYGLLPIVGLFGNFQDGKSLLINDMLGVAIAPSGGMGVSTTAVNTVYRYGEEFTVTGLRGGSNPTREEVSVDDFRANRLPPGLNCVVVTVPSETLKHIRVLDSPGVNAHDDESAEAYRALGLVDAAIVVTVNHGLAEFHTSLISEIERCSLPYVVVMNCFRRLSPSSWHPQSEFNASIGEKNESQLKAEGFSPMTMREHGTILPINALWYWYACGLYKGVELTGPMTMALEDVADYAAFRTIRREECGVDELVRFVVSPRFLAPALVRRALKKDVEKLRDYSEGQRRYARICMECCRDRAVEEADKETCRLESVTAMLREEIDRSRRRLTELDENVENSGSLFGWVIAVGSRALSAARLEREIGSSLNRLEIEEWKIKSWKNFKNNLEKCQ